MAINESGLPGSTGLGTSDWTTSNETRDRRPAGPSGGIAQLVRDTTYQRLGDQKERASETLGSLAGAVRGMTQPLRDGGQPAIADYATRAADGIERWSSQLRQQNVQDALREAQRFARREPALFLGLAFGAGLLAARFLKSSNEDAEKSESSGRSWNPPSSGFSTTPSSAATTYPSSPSTYPTSPSMPSSGSEVTPRLGSAIRPAGEAL
ncbi:MAG: hypothetical protein H0T71_01735 [Acidobacteria bacterium]|nr:hypothetical protein [Acidobacteriota bacterium]